MNKLRRDEWWGNSDPVPSVREAVLVREAESRAEQHAEIDNYERRLYAVADKIDPVVATVNGLGLDCTWHVRVRKHGVEISCWLVAPIQAWSALLPLLEAFDAAGLVEVGKWRNVDLAASYTRHFYAPVVENAVDPDNTPQLQLSIYANLPGDTEGCRRVVKGFTEGYVSKPEPIYAFECGPEAELPINQGEAHHGI